MKQEELTEAIRGGINRSRNDLARDIIIVCAVIAGALLLIFAVAYFTQEDNCGESGCQNDVALEPVPKCNKPYIDCLVYDYGGDLVSAPRAFCGFEEAYYWYKMFEETYVNETFIDCWRD